MGPNSPLKSRSRYNYNNKEFKSRSKNTNFNKKDFKSRSKNINHNKINYKY